MGAASDTDHARKQDAYDRLKRRLVCEVKGQDSQEKAVRAVSIEEMHGMAIWLYRKDSEEQARHMDSTEARWLFHPAPWETAGGVEPRPQRKGRHTRQLASQRQTADAAAGAYNFQRTLQELTAGLNWDPQPAAANSGHTITPPRRMPVWR
ncbi:hypothetical protein WJX84_001532 [Apatococcus fuscideae]|uniref:Uncharacterized protein n=1 Tax=Apatococcus fuscideae TaxID=2026836 RepID=A0AAW1SVX2_9CHLO